MQYYFLVESVIFSMLYYCPEPRQVTTPEADDEDVFVGYWAEITSR